MLSLLAAPLAAIMMVGTGLPVTDASVPVVNRAQNMSLAPWAEPAGTTSYSCTLVMDTGFSCIWDCGGDWIITPTDDCSVPPN
ncbi:hypothetical protein [Hyphomonas sp.]|jgi:hypothetical protein|uniref:hypothetical protein n=1 Tax=Hyphomonas sp. TaxID=87 RepID=UPI003001F598